MGAGVVDWNAWGVSWLGSWGESWGPLHVVDELRRPRSHPNVKFTRIRDARVQLNGEVVHAQFANVTPRGVVEVYLEPVVEAKYYLSGASVRCSASQLSARGASLGRLSGARSSAAAGTLGARSGCRAGAPAQWVEVTSGRLYATGGATAFSGSFTVESGEGLMNARGVRNPTDEELMMLVHSLTSKQVTRIQSRNFVRS